MLDHLLEVMYETDRRTAAQIKLAADMEAMPPETLHAIVNGTEKLAYFDGGGHDWLDRYKGSPLFDQAYALEKESLTLSMQNDAQQRERSDTYRAYDAKRDALCIKKKMLDLELAKSNEGGGGEEPAVETAPAEVAAEPKEASALRQAGSRYKELLTGSKIQGLQDKLVRKGRDHFKFPNADGSVTAVYDGKGIGAAGKALRSEVRKSTATQLGTGAAAAGAAGLGAKKLFGGKKEASSHALVHVPQAVKKGLSTKQKALLAGGATLAAVGAGTALARSKKKEAALPPALLQRAGQIADKEKQPLASGSTLSMKSLGKGAPAAIKAPQGWIPGGSIQGKSLAKQAATAAKFRRVADLLTGRHAKDLGNAAKTTQNKFHRHGLSQAAAREGQNVTKARIAAGGLAASGGAFGLGRATKEASFAKEKAKEAAFGAVMPALRAAGSHLARSGKQVGAAFNERGIQAAGRTVLRQGKSFIRKHPGVAAAGAGAAGLGAGYAAG